MEHTAFEIAERDATPTGGAAVAVCVSRWGDALFVGTGDGRVVLLAGGELEAEAEARVVSAGAGGVKQVVAADALGLLLVLGGNRLHALDQASLEPVDGPAAAPPGAALLATCADGLRLAVAGDTLRIYDLAHDSEDDPYSGDLPGGCFSSWEDVPLPRAGKVDAAAWFQGSLFVHSTRRGKGGAFLRVDPESLEVTLLHAFSPEEEEEEAQGRMALGGGALGGGALGGGALGGGALGGGGGLVVPLPCGMLLLVAGQRGGVLDSGSSSSSSSGAVVHLAWPTPPTAAVGDGDYLVALLPTEIAIHCLSGTVAGAFWPGGPIFSP
ncbi:hypothetical protein T484DRAFT_1891182, partial [Baffinella frigidus]